jgi:hypothetical protein
MFSDESMISRVGSFGRKYYYSDREHRRQLPHQVRPTPQTAGGKMMIWGCITFFGKGDLSRINGTLNSGLYLDVLKDYVLSSLAWWGMDPANSVFQQDDSSVHTCRTMKKWLDE